MACLGSLKGIGRSCKNNLAGIKEVYLGDFDLFVATGADGKLTTITGKEGAKFYTYKLAKQTGSFTTTLTKDETTGVFYYTHEVNLQFLKMEAEKHLEIEALSRGQLACAVLDNNGKYWYLTDENYVSGEDTVAQAGQSFDDLNGYTTVLRGQGSHLAYEITGDEEGQPLHTFKDLIEDAPTEE